MFARVHPNAGPHTDTPIQRVFMHEKASLVYFQSVVNTLGEADKFVGEPRTFPATLFPFPVSNC